MRRIILDSQQYVLISRCKLISFSSVGISASSSAAVNFTLFFFFLFGLKQQSNLKHYEEMCPWLGASDKLFRHWTGRPLSNPGVSKCLDANDSERKWRRQQGDWPIALKRRHRKRRESAPLFSSRGRGKGGQEVRWARQNEEMGSGGEIRFIRGGEREQSVISILTLPLEEDCSCRCDKGLVQP